MSQQGQIENGNLSGIEVSTSGDTVSLHLVDDLPPYGCRIFVCTNVYTFILHRSAGDKVPFYLGELIWKELGEEEKRATLERLKYPIFNEQGDFLVMKEKLIHIHLDGGICGDILAESVTLTAPS